MVYAGGTLEPASKGIKDMRAWANISITWNGQKTVFPPFPSPSLLN